MLYILGSSLSENSKRQLPTKVAKPAKLKTRRDLQYKPRISHRGALSKFKLTRIAGIQRPSPHFNGKGSCSLCGGANVPGRHSRLDSSFSVTKLQLGAFQFEKSVMHMHIIRNASTKFVFGGICVTFVGSLF